MFHRIESGTQIDYRGPAEQFCDRSGYLVYEIDTTHVDLDHGVFNYGPMTVTIPVKVIDKSFWLWFCSTAISSASGNQSQYMGGRVFQCDKEIAKGIYLLNKYGLKTSACCVGHPLFRDKGWETDGFYVMFCETDPFLIDRLREYVRTQCRHIHFESKSGGISSIGGRVTECETYEDMINKKQEIIDEFYDLVRHFCGVLNTDFQDVMISGCPGYIVKHEKMIRHGMSLMQYCPKCKEILYRGVGIVNMTERALDWSYTIKTDRHDCGITIMPVDVLMREILDMIKEIPSISLDSIISPLRYVKYEGKFYLSRPKFKFHIDFCVTQEEIDHIGEKYKIDLKAEKDGDHGIIITSSDNYAYKIIDKVPEYDELEVHDLAFEKENYELCDKYVTSPIIRILRDLADLSVLRCSEFGRYKTQEFLPIQGTIEIANK